MIEARANEAAPEEGAVSASASGQRPMDSRTVSSSSGPLATVGSETFGWIHPDVADRPLTRRERRPQVTRLGVLAVTLSAIGIVVSWFGPWGAAIGIIGAVLGAVALFRRTERRRWCWTAILAGCVSILFSAYWLTWILPQLAVPELTI
ncbi:hypothetical protein [Microbacterium karelineae]|uniref:hypothetical protein n=1 Tax=Microbacterium karelineae TaxID=2654283 RepID=UPI0012EA54BD|nr:hypothetical protein [Microbacterium karelineae]